MNVGDKVKYHDWIAYICDCKGDKYDIEVMLPWPHTLTNVSGDSLSPLGEWNGNK